VKRVQQAKWHWHRHWGEVRCMMIMQLTRPNATASANRRYTLLVKLVSWLYHMGTGRNVRRLAASVCVQALGHDTSILCENQWGHESMTHACPDQPKQRHAIRSTLDILVSCTWSTTTELQGRLLLHDSLDSNLHQPHQHQHMLLPGTAQHSPPTLCNLLQPVGPFM
jgi:hypothetical protein